MTIPAAGAIAALVFLLGCASTANPGQQRFADGDREGNPAQSSHARLDATDRHRRRGRSSRNFNTGRAAAAMRTGVLRHRVAALLDRADIRIDGDRSWDIHVHDDRLYRRILAEGVLGVGESYMDGWWDCDRLDEMFHRVLAARLDREIRQDWRMLVHLGASRLMNLQSRRRSHHVARQHYDLDTDLYMSFLDPYNQYSCAYFRGTEELDRAQVQKLELICRKLQLTVGERVLDIGCGWGGFARYAAERYGCHVTGVTISPVQAAYARDFCRGLDVEILESDYRNLPRHIGAAGVGKVLSCGMIEHVGYRNYASFMRVVAHCLPERGMFLLHTVGGRRTKTTLQNRWLARYIFPNAMMPSLKQLAGAAEGLLVVEDLHAFGPRHYEKTLLAWYDNFERNWHTISARHDERFFRMWRFYLLHMAGSFRADQQHLWQIVLSKNGVGGEYAAVRY
jgi:cyclopropane-fatty-acyl-phospholipid synthase